MRIWPLLLFIFAFCPTNLLAQEPVDTFMIRRIVAEATNNSQIMDNAFFLTDVYGPRLTGSPSFKEAGEWTLNRLNEMGLENAHTESFDWGRSWSAKNFSIHLVEPQYAPLIGSAIPWSRDTNGPVEAEPILAPLPDREALPEEYEAFYRTYKGKLHDRVILGVEPWPREADRTWPRLSDEDLDHALSKADEEYLASRGRSLVFQPPPVTQRQYLQLQEELNQFLNEEGAAAILIQSMAYSGTVLTTGPLDSRMQAAWLRDEAYTLPPATAVLAAEHYRRITRLLERGVPARIRIALDAVIHNDPESAFNIVAEIPGSEKRDEVAMLGAHFDSWTAATGATDNAAGCAVVMEAMRILSALGVEPDRTIRMVLWGGHEGPGVGSRSYLRTHFVDNYPVDELDMVPRENYSYKPDHSKLSAYFNLDHGAGRIRGIHLQGNEAIRPIFQAWLEPFRDRGAVHTTLAYSWGTDHDNFDEVGLPGFQFIQDRKDTATPTHHSNMDVYDYLPEADLQQSAMILASFVYHAAMRDELLPRKSLSDRN